MYSLFYIYLIIYVYKKIFGRVFNLSTQNTEWMLKSPNQTLRHIFAYTVAETCNKLCRLQYNLNLYLMI